MYTSALLAPTYYTYNMCKLYDDKIKLRGSKQYRFPKCRYPIVLSENSAKSLKPEQRVTRVTSRQQEVRLITGSVVNQSTVRQRRDVSLFTAPRGIITHFPQSHLY